jgi:hypothetical protein
MAKRYQRHNQKPYIKEGQSIQWPKDTKGITRSCISKEDSQYNGQCIFWPLHWLSFFDIRLLVMPFVSFGHCIDCPSLICGFWSFLWCLLAIVLNVLLWYTASGYAFGIFWPLHWLSFFDIPLLVMPLVSFYHCIDYPPLIYSFWLCLWYLLAIVLTVILWYTASGYAFGIVWPLYWLSFFIWLLDNGQKIPNE